MSRVWDKERKKRKEKGRRKGADNHLFNLFPVFQGRDKEGEATVKASPRGKAESQRRRRVSQFFPRPLAENRGTIHRARRIAHQRRRSRDDE